MNTTGMLGDVVNSGEAMNGIHNPGDFLDSPTVDAMPLEELDVGGSEFSCSSVGSGRSPSTAEAQILSSGTTLEGDASAMAAEETKANTSTKTGGEHGSEPSVKKHPLYFWDTITFKVKGILFQLPKFRFFEESDEFMAMVAGGVGPNEAIELDVTLGDFESFLKAFLPRSSSMYDERPQLNTDEWISVLKLSTKWLFIDLRKLAISRLSSIRMDAIDRICLAKEYSVYDWLLEGYEHIVERLLTPPTSHRGFPLSAKHTLTTHEARRIGMEVALELSGIAIRQLTRPAADDVKSNVLNLFRKEFGCVQRYERRFITRAEQLEEEAIERERQAEAERLKQDARLQAEAQRLEEEARVQAEADRLKEEARMKVGAERLKEEARITAEAERLKEAARIKAEAEDRLMRRMPKKKRKGKMAKKGDDDEEGRLKKERAEEGGTTSLAEADETSLKEESRDIEEDIMGHANRGKATQLDKEASKGVQEEACERVKNEAVPKRPEPPKPLAQKDEKLRGDPHETEMMKGGMSSEDLRLATLRWKKWWDI